MSNTQTFPTGNDIRVVYRPQNEIIGRIALL